MPKTMENLIQQYIEEIKKIYGVHLRSIILYGSYARGDFRPDSDIDIMILDMNFCQPFDYQHILSKNPQHEIANIVKEQVEKWMKYLHDNGVINGHEYGDYI